MPNNSEDDTTLLLQWDQATQQFNPIADKSSGIYLEYQGVKGLWLLWIWPLFNVIFRMMYLGTWVRRSNVLTGAEVLAVSGDAQLNPASNAKIVTAACALKVLGPAFRFATTLHGDRHGAAVRGPLALRGGADPTLDSAGLLAMALELRNQGVRRVEGGVQVDDTFFDKENLPFAFGRKPGEAGAFRAPVGAASLNRNTLAITIGPGPLWRWRARVSLDPPGYAEVVNETATVWGYRDDPRISVGRAEGRARVRVSGTVPLRARPVTYVRRADDPSTLTGYGLRAALERAGISVSGGVTVAPLPENAPLLVERLSEPLSAILPALGKESNNFVAETVLKTLAVAAGGKPATWDRAVEVVASVLAGWGIGRDACTYRNGSGLYDADRFSARQLVQVLRRAYLDPEIRPEFLAQLATGGVDGTIAGRFRSPPARGRVRAKTGTLAGVSALSGYVFDAEGRSPLAFSVLVNGAWEDGTAARRCQDRIVAVLADFLNPSEPPPGAGEPAAEPDVLASAPLAGAEGGSGPDRLCVMIGSAFEGHPLGHVALCVLGDDYRYVFDMGRYLGGTPLGLSGAAVLRVWIGEEGFRLYRTHELETSRSTACYLFASSFVRNQRVIDFYKKRIATGRLRKAAHHGAMREYVLRDRFHVFSNNCVTIAVEGFEAAFPEIDLRLPAYNTGRNLGRWEAMLVRRLGWPEGIWCPLDLRAELDEAYAGHPYLVGQDVWRK